MGRYLEARAWQTSRTRLPNLAARVVLMRMAHTALDTDHAPAYFGGWPTLAVALGYDDPTSHAAELAVGRAVRQLVEVGLIKPDGDTPGGNRRYLITL